MDLLPVLVPVIIVAGFVARGYFSKWGEYLFENRRKPIDNWRKARAYGRLDRNLSAGRISRPSTETHDPIDRACRKLADLSSRSEGLTGQGFQPSQRFGLLIVGAGSDNVLRRSPTSRSISRDHVWLVEDLADVANRGDCLDSTMCDAERAFAERQITALAVILTIPLTGDWTEENTLDLGALFKRICQNESLPLCITYDERVDLSDWPDTILVRVPDSSVAVNQHFSSLGVPSIEVHPLHKKSRTYEISARVAADQLVHLMHSDDEGAVPKHLPISEGHTIPAYSSYIALAIAAPSGPSPTRQVEGTVHEVTGLSEFLHCQSITLMGRTSDNSSYPLPISLHRNRVTAWRVAHLPESQLMKSKERTQPSNDRADILTLAIETRDWYLANAVVFQHGRAWLEALDARQRLVLLENVRETFGLESRPGLWAHYLIAIDSALRQENPSAEYFTTKICDLAYSHGLGRLFVAERLEFMRLRGEVDLCLDEFASEWPHIKDHRGELSPEGRYVDATADFVLSNILRRGGRYDRAKRLIQRAQQTYCASIPAMAVEMNHCLYAASVCDAMSGFTRIMVPNQSDRHSYVFAISLVELSNAQAAWFIGDVERCLQFLQRAEEGFQSIHYGRHIRRVRRTRELMQASISLSAGKIPSKSKDRVVQLSITAALKHSEQLDLTDQRPSVALSILEFGIRSAAKGTDARSVRLPKVLLSSEARSFSVSDSETAGSLVEADLHLRALMGIERSQRIPLAPD